MKNIIMTMTEETARVVLSCLRKGALEFPDKRMHDIAGQSAEALAYCLMGGETKPEPRTDEPLPDCKLVEDDGEET